uniref:Reverse transcriptase Ty1/copia-type domain-containing protein n=1 Tax=Triticum urartu TaxID=4572 RepID=A0A8R7UMI0_TRIUA
MTTRAKRGFGIPARRLNLLASTSTISPVPKTYRSALHDPHWLEAMRSEFDAFKQNDTWELVPRPPSCNVVLGKWLFRHKFHADGSLARYKARWVCRGFSQQPGIDYDETFSPVVKPSTIRAVLSIATSSHWPIHQLDVKNAFLHGTLTETVYCQQPQGFEDPSFPDHVCLLKKSLYGLKQAPRAWFSRFATYIQTLGFLPSKSDSSLFTYHSDNATAYLLLYVDDIILTCSSTTFLNSLIASLRSEFSMTDLGALHHFLGITVTRSSAGLFLSQRQYLSDLIDRASMTDCHIARTPVDTGNKLDSSGNPVSDPAFYRSLAGALQYATLTRPDIAYAVQQACLFMHDPRDPHLALVKRIIRYLKGTLHLGLHINTSSPTSLTAYS